MDVYIDFLFEYLSKDDEHDALIECIIRRAMQGKA